MAADCTGTPIQIVGPDASAASMVSLREGRCILCQEKSKLTEEHIWANWLKKHIPRIEQTYTSTSIIAGRESKQVSDKDYRDLTLPVLCADCNNRWGSKLHKNTIPILTRLFAGDWWQLSKHEREQLTRWIFLFVTVREYVHPELITTMPAVRREFRRTSSLPKGFYTWIAPCQSENNVLSAWQRAFTTQNRSGEYNADTKITTFVLPNFLICSVFTSNEWCEDDQSSMAGAHSMLNSIGLARLWPTGASFPIEKPRTLVEEMFSATLPLVDLALREPRTILQPGPLKFKFDTDASGVVRASINKDSAT